MFSLRSHTKNQINLPLLYISLEWLCMCTVQFRWWSTWRSSTCTWQSWASRGLGTGSSLPSWRKPANHDSLWQSCMCTCSKHPIYPDAIMASVQMQSCHLSRCNHVICPDAITSSIQMTSWHLSKYSHVIYPDAIMSSIQVQPWHLSRCYHDIYPDSRCNHVIYPDAIMTSIEMQSFHLSRCYHDIYSDAIMTSIQILSWHLSRCYHVIFSDVIMSSIQMQSLSSIQMQSCHLSNHAIFPDAIMSSIQLVSHHHCAIKTWINRVFFAHSCYILDANFSSNWISETVGIRPKVAGYGNKRISL